MVNLLVLCYGVVAYLIGLSGLLYFLLYVGGWEFLPLHIDSRQPGPLPRAIAINLGLILLFGIQHSVMARIRFKHRMTKLLPHAIERSTYVLLSGLLMYLICGLWQPIAGTLWSIENEYLATLLIAVQISGWLILVGATFEIDHFELMGLRQVWQHARSQEFQRPPFKEKYLYRIVRHPIQLGILIGMWVTPVMTITHLMMAITMTVYIFIGLYFEEQTLIAMIGQRYEEYRKRVPKLIPFLKPRSIAVSDE